MLKAIIAVGLGSCTGGVLRYLISVWMKSTFKGVWPWGTTIVNLLGAFLLGLLYTWLERHELMNDQWRLFLMVGFCGGFTTFSTFASELFFLFRSGEVLACVAYMLATVLLGFLLFATGYNLLK